MITKNKFLIAYNNHPPKKWVELGYKYFSKSTKPEDAHVKKWTKTTLIGLFILMMIGGFINISMSIMIYPIIIYSVIIFGLAICMVSATVVNNRRIKKIAKELGVSLIKYQALVNIYLK